MSDTSSDTSSDTLPNTVYDSIYTHLEQTLTAARPMKPQVLQALMDTFTLEESQLQTFLDTQLSELESYQKDVLFSPQFTPKLEDRQAVVALLQGASLSESEVDRLMQQVEGASWVMPLDLPSANVLRLPLQAEFTERFIRLLKLEASVPESLQAVLASGNFSEAHRTLALALSREAHLHKPEALALWASFLQRWTPTLTEELLTFFADFLKTYRPQTEVDLARQLEALITSCRDDADRALERSYHNEDLRMQHRGGEKDHHQASEVRAQYQKQMQQAQIVLALYSVTTS
jgi:hypothetical protein